MFPEDDCVPAVPDAIFLKGMGASGACKKGALLEAAQPWYSRILELIYSVAPYSLHKWMLLSTEM